MSILYIIRENFMIFVLRLFNCHGNGNLYITISVWYKHNIFELYKAQVVRAFGNDA